MQIRSRQIVCAALALTSPITTVYAQQPAATDLTAPAVAVPAGCVEVPERTEVKVELQEDLKSGANKTGEEVPYKLSEDVYGPGHVLLIPAGALAFGKITKSSRRGMFGKAGKLEFTCDYIQIGDGKHLPLRSDPMGGSGHGNSGAVIATALFLSVLGVFVNGRDITVPKGKVFPMYVDKPTIIPAPFVAGAAPNPAAADGPAKSLFTLKNGDQVVGSISSFDGTVYQINTDAGMKTIQASNVKSVYTLAAK
jgi:hypothetical protein